MEHALLQTLHLLCAILFIGVVFFEVVFLEPIRKHLPENMMTLVEAGIHVRARRFMPFVVVLLFASGIGMLWRVYSNLWLPLFAQPFSVLLTLKILLALSVLIHFVLAIRASLCNRMTSRRFRITHYSVFAHMILIVILAKAMFYA
ncbi:CopD family copper resistance protein [Thalassolituus pacificus]|uniref:Uncharacterized protein n=1 Tax=Thalassolituus pacificus TaxID=2975440 RepID=A0A9X3ARI6_9GAMM|nr:hypothetical protein [Thalassolituus pacificus]MCT7358849.1 hypothetical protein [Thalassolituus pacificus]